MVRRTSPQSLDSSMLVGTVAATVLGALTEPLLVEAQRRHSCNARAAFAAAVSSPALKDPMHNPIEIASLIAAEEHSNGLVMPQHVSQRIQSDIEQIIAPAAKRIALSKMVGSEVTSESIAVAVSSTLFGNSEAPDDISLAAGEDSDQGEEARYYIFP